MIGRTLLSGRYLVLLRPAVVTRGWDKFCCHRFSGASKRRKLVREVPLLSLTRAAAEAGSSPAEGPKSAYSCFKEIGVDEILLAPLWDQGVRQPTDVQRAAIPEILKGANVAVQSYTGSGKTLAYLLPVMTLALKRAELELETEPRKKARTVQAMIVAPSRELAMQIVRVAQSLLPETARRSVQQCIGGANALRQKDALQEYKPFMVVGTPGRLAELSRDGALATHNCGILVLDEADQLLAPQFREEMTRITEHCGRRFEPSRQTILVSATLTPKVLLHCQQWCPDPIRVFVGTAASGLVAAADKVAEQQTAAATNVLGAGSQRDSSSSRTVGGIAGLAKPSWGWGLPGATKVSPAVDMPTTTGSAGGFATDDVRHTMPPQLLHYYASSAPQHKVDNLRRAMHALGVERALVFMNYQHRLKETEGKLAARHMEVGSLHGELTKQERQAVLQKFRKGSLRALIVSDVAARGLDIPECDAVFHLELPTDASHYAHRAGRTGRAGRPGVVVSLVSGGERYVVDKLGKKLGIPIKEVEFSHGEARDVESGSGSGSD